jgi:hypothetical protein
MTKAVLLAAALALLALGGEGLVHGIRSGRQVATTCAEFIRGRPSSDWVSLSDCDIDYAGAGYRDSGGRVEELFFPVRPTDAGDSAVGVVAATRSESATAIAQSAFGGGRQPTTDQSIKVMQQIVVALRMDDRLDGLVRSRLLERVRARRVVSGLAVPLANDAVVIDVHGTPGMLMPAAEFLAGLVLAVVALRLSPWRGQEVLPIEVAPAAVAPDSEPASDAALASMDLRGSPRGAPWQSTADDGLDLSGLELRPFLPPQPAPAVAAPAAAPPPTLASAAASVTAPIPVPAIEAATASHIETDPEPALPALMLLNLDPLASLDAIESAPPLGSREDVTTMLHALMPDLELDRRRHGQLTWPGGAVVLDIGAADPVQTAVIRARGRQGIVLVRSVLEMTGWRAFAPKYGRFVDIDAIEEIAAGRGLGSVAGPASGASAP